MSHKVDETEMRFIRTALILKGAECFQAHFGERTVWYSYPPASLTGRTRISHLNCLEYSQLANALAVELVPSTWRALPYTVSEAWQLSSLRILHASMHFKVPGRVWIPAASLQRLQRQPPAESLSPLLSDRVEQTVLVASPAFAFAVPEVLLTSWDGCSLFSAPSLPFRYVLPLWTDIDFASNSFGPT